MPRIDVDKYGASWIGDRTATIADYKERVAELERALSRLAVWAKTLSDEAPDEMPLPADVTHLSLTVRDAREALRVLGMSYFDCPICEGACSTHH